jgi:hypothetical protein
MSLPSKKICAIWLFVFASMNGWAAAISQTEKPPIPADLYFEFKAVPANENAIIRWRQAAEVTVALTDKEKAVIKFCWTPVARVPSTDDLNDLRSWLKRNQEALALFDGSLQKPKAQWPERNFRNPQPELITLSLMIQAHLFEAEQLAEQNKFTEAAVALENNLKLAQMGINGDATLFQYLVTCRARTMTQDAILRLAGQKQVPLSILKELLRSLPNLDSETNTYDHALRVDFIGQYNDTFDPKKLTESLSKMSGTNAALYLNFYPDDLQHAFKILLDPSLVPLHPKPYDANAEIEKTIQHYRIYQANALVPWTERDGQVELDDENDHTNLVQDVAPLMELLKNDPLPLSRPAAQKARIAYSNIENPIGRILDTSVLSFVTSDLKICQVQTERETTQTCLALIIFERLKGQLPASLSDLVTEKILTSVPVDPFNGEPLHYSREKRKVWSVSNNGVDDHGESGSTRWYQADAVWQIPELH